MCKSFMGGRGSWVRGCVAAVLCAAPRLGVPWALVIIRAGHGQAAGQDVGGRTGELEAKKELSEHDLGGHVI